MAPEVENTMVLIHVEKVFDKMPLVVSLICGAY
jgi:hypothetical protein